MPVAEQTPETTGATTATTTTAEGGAEGQRQITLRIDETEMSSGYANTFRADHSLDEVILDFGMNRSVPGRDEMVFKVRQQVVLNWRGAKRLALTLSNLIRQYEEKVGEIEVNPRGRQTPGAGESGSA